MKRKVESGERKYAKKFAEILDEPLKDFDIVNFIKYFQDSINWIDSSIGLMKDYGTLPHTLSPEEVDTYLIVVEDRLAKIEEELKNHPDHAKIEASGTISERFENYYARLKSMRKRYETVLKQINLKKS